MIIYTFCFRSIPIEYKYQYKCLFFLFAVTSCYYGKKHWLNCYATQGIEMEPFNFEKQWIQNNHLIEEWINYSFFIIQFKHYSILPKDLKSIIKQYYWNSNLKRNMKETILNNHQFSRIRRYGYRDRIELSIWQNTHFKYTISFLNFGIILFAHLSFFFPISIPSCIILSVLPIFMVMAYISIL